MIFSWNDFNIFQHVQQYSPLKKVSQSHMEREADGTSGSQAYSPWMTSLCTCAALDLRPERGNQGAVYGTMAFTFHRSALTFHAVIF